MKPEIKKFIARHHQSERELIKEEIAPYRDMSPEESFEVIAQLSRATALMLAKHPDREAILSYRDPPHPSYKSIIERLRTTKPKT
jgi:acetyl-CoA carboxylase alpha subunit